MQSFIHTLRWPAMLLIAMSGMIVSVVDLQAQPIPPKLAASDQAPSEFRGIQPDTERPPSGPPSQAQLVQVLQQRGVSVDAQTLAANRGKRKLRGSSQVPSELGQPDDGRARLQRPSQAALLQRMRQTSEGRARLDEARRRGAPVGTTTGQAPQGGRSLGSPVADNLMLASIAGPTWGLSSSEVSPTKESGDWSVFLSVDVGGDTGGSLHLSRAHVNYQTVFKMRAGGCAKMLLKIPTDGWYMVWYMVNIASQTQWVVKAGNTVLATFTGNGTPSFYPLVLEMGRGNHWINACNPSSANYVRYYMSGAYDLP